MFNAKLWTPVRVNVMSGVVLTLFMIAAEHFSTGSNAATFTVVPYLATSTTLLSYLLIFPAWGGRMHRGVGVSTVKDVRCCS